MEIAQTVINCEIDTLEASAPLHLTFDASYGAS